MLFKREVEKLKEIFWKNGYSDAFFNKVYKAFEEKISAGNIQTEEDDDSRRYIFKIPYVGTISHDFKNRLIRMFYNEHRISISPVFNTFKVSRYFGLKSQTPKLICSNVVYKFTSLCDANITYIGKTKRHLSVRGLEHLEFSQPKPEGEIKTHLQSCSICQKSTLDNFQIMKKCRNDHETKINEAMCIKNENPKLNKSLFNKGSLYTFKLYI